MTTRDDDILRTRLERMGWSITRMGPDGDPRTPDVTCGFAHRGHHYGAFARRGSCVEGDDGVLFVSVAESLGGLAARRVGATKWRCAVADGARAKEIGEAFARGLPMAMEYAAGLAVVERCGFTIDHARSREETYDDYGWHIHARSPAELLRVGIVFRPPHGPAADTEIGPGGDATVWTSRGHVFVAVRSVPLAEELLGVIARPTGPP